MTHIALPRHPSADSTSDDPLEQAYELLHWMFVAVPAVAGLDKLTHVLVDWDVYLAPGIPRGFGTTPHSFLIGVGLVEVGMALLVALRPRIGAAVVALWLAAIVIDLLSLQKYYDVALRDFGLLLAACALGRLAVVRERNGSVARERSRSTA